MQQTKLATAINEAQKEYFVKDIVWDLECYPNVFLFAACFASGKGMRVYEISDRKNDTEEMLEFLRNVVKGGFRMVGFNNIGFDYPLLHYILEKSKSARTRNVPLQIGPGELYRFMENMFKEMKENPFGRQMRESEMLIKQVDLFKVWHYDNKAKSTSLKMLENNMRSQNIEDLPFPVGKILTSDEIDELIRYNKHDVLETTKFYYYSVDGLKMRRDLTEQFGFDCTNYNDTKIGKELFVNRLEAARPGICYKVVKKGPRTTRQLQQTKRKNIPLGECVLPYVKFDRPEFKAIHAWFMQKTIVETKGALTDLEEHELGDVAKYANMKIKSVKMNCPVEGSKNKKYVPTRAHVDDMMKLHPLGWIEAKALKSPKGAVSYNFCWRVTAGVERGGKKATSSPLNVVIDGFQYDFGTGGIHGAATGVWSSDEEMQIYTYDVKSYYPNLSIKNKLYPAHLDILFCSVYDQLYQERASYDKKAAANKALKLALNGTYGASNDQYSPMFDPKFTMSITINGQLLLCMLMEKMLTEVGAQVIMCNTDGFEFIAPKAAQARIKELVADWEKLTGLEMEGALYTKMIIRDVNNYISIKSDEEL